MNTEIAEQMTELLVQSNLYWIVDYKQFPLYPAYIKLHSKYETKFRKKYKSPKIEKYIIETNPVLWTKSPTKLLHECCDLKSLLLVHETGVIDNAHEYSVFGWDWRFIGYIVQQLDTHTYIVQNEHFNCDLYEWVAVKSLVRFEV